jgi:hypothetical protein
MISSNPSPERNERDTDRPESDAARPAAELSQDEAWNKRFEEVLKKQRETDSKVDGIYSLLMGASPSGRPSPTGKGGAGQALHDQTTHLGVISANTELVAESMKDLPRLVAQEVANKVLEMFSSEVSTLKERADDHDARIQELEGIIVP